MTKPTWVVSITAAFALTALAAGCSKPSKEDIKICEQAGKRYLTCIEETMGKEMADIARSKEGGVEACAEDKRTVEFYRDKCLPTKNCREFMDCTMDLAMQEP